MSLPTQYLTSTKKLSDFLSAIQTAQAPSKFTLSFLESLGFKSSSDRLLVGVLKALGFLAESGEPTDRYYRYLDQTQSERVLAEGIREAYGDLFQINIKAQELSRTEVRNKFRTLSQGEYSEDVLTKMAGTFKALADIADFSEPIRATPIQPETAEVDGDVTTEEVEPPLGQGIELGGLVYNIQLQLPESRDPAVYAAFFKSLKEHLLR